MQQRWHFGMTWRVYVAFLWPRRYMLLLLLGLWASENTSLAIRVRSFAMLESVVLTICAFSQTALLGVAARYAIAKRRYESCHMVVNSSLGLQSWTLALRTELF